MNASTPREIVGLVNVIQGSEGVPAERAKEYVKACMKMLEESSED